MGRRIGELNLPSKSNFNTGGSGSPSLVDLYTKMGEEATTTNKARENEIRNIYANILSSISGNESSLRASGLSDIETQSKNLIGQETQNLISSGLYGTTTASGVPTKVATQFTQPARMKLEDLITQRKQTAQLGMADFIERIQNAYPDYSQLAQAEAAKASAPTMTKTINSYPGFKSL